MPDMKTLAAFFRFLALAATVTVYVPDSANAQTATEDALETVDAVESDFKDMLDEIDDTTGKLDAFLENIELADKTFRVLIEKNKNHPERVKQLKEALRVVRTVQTEVYDQVGNLKLLQKGAGHVKSAFDLYDKVKEIRDRAKARKGGPLAKNLSVLADVMKEYGGNVPLIGDAIEMYGDITGQLLGATDKLAGTINEKFKQDMIGGGVSQNIDDPRYLRLKEQFPDLADETLAPAGPDYLFKNVVDNNDPRSYIWDEKAKSWYVVKGPVPATKIFGRVLANGSRPTPRQLAFLVSHGDAALKREQNAQQVLSIMRRLRGSINMDVEFGATRLYGLDIIGDQRIPELFLSRYIYDGKYRDLVRKYAAQIWMNARTMRGSARFARALDDWAKNAGFDLYDTLTEDQKAELAARLEALEAERQKAKKEKEERKKKKKPKKPEQMATADQKPELEQKETKTAPSPAGPASTIPPTQKPKNLINQPKTSVTPPTAAPNLPNATITPWDKALPRSVCLAYQKQISKSFDGANYRNLKAVGDPSVDEKDGGTCNIRFSGEMKDAKGKWQQLDQFQLSFYIKDIRNHLSQLSGENAYNKVCANWKTVEWCEGGKRICVAHETYTYCVGWKGEIARPECAKYDTKTVCSKWDWVCVKAHARTYCDKWAPVTAQKTAPQPVKSAPLGEKPKPSVKEDKAADSSLNCEEIAKKYPSWSLNPAAIKARMKCLKIGK
ncbi:hypothetical protein [Roseibium aggregatum]|uniref:Uncharacterized protein n=1 Tax=Roseibium aggregatum TaxID=187304 RepID=A0A926NWE5_9HYPH|nr:hypothetical protein [Roseibium aggregatum]MBD1545355.1 hypothetical protein [Roseibium aggregatum]